MSTAGLTAAMSRLRGRLPRGGSAFMAGCRLKTASQRARRAHLGCKFSLDTPGVDIDVREKEDEMPSNRH